MAAENHPLAPADLAQLVRTASEGDRDAARRVLAAVQDDVYGLALRMLGHPADAEDAAQEILIIVLTHLGSFRGESGFRTWVWTIAANHLRRVRRGRREVITFDALEENLRTGIDLPLPALSDPEIEAVAGELRLRCTEAMLLSLDRDLRLAYVLGDLFDLSSEEGAEVLGLTPPAFRKRLSRARLRLHEFVRGWCGVYDEANPCRCAKQVGGAVERNIIAPEDLYLSRQRLRPDALARAAGEVTDLLRVAEMLRGPAYGAPEGLAGRIRELIDARPFEIFRE
jgi:RNA polymerase sigma factor (sigma-70 family)